MRYGFFIVVLALLAPITGHSQDQVLRIYQDADLSNHKESSLAIQHGIEVAFDEVGNEVQGYKIAFEYLDHRGNVIRSKRNYQQFLDDPSALAIYSGIHSPPLIRNRTFINENKALTLVPWAAGGPVTRHPSPENWIFRLSVDDMRAGATIIDYAIGQKKCRSPRLLLEDTPWGHSNRDSMSKALLKYEIEIPSITLFGWNLQQQGARILLRKIAASGNDCVILVANAIEGAVIAEAMLSLPEGKRMPIISHWGITGGNFHETITKDKRQQLDIKFIQTCFAFTNEEQSPLAQSVFSRLKEKSMGNIEQPRDLKSAVGFIHAYDMTKLLIAAMGQVQLSGDMVQDRDAIRLALENLQTPVQGLVTQYQRPYTQFNAENINAHEALHEEHYCMAHYGDDNEIIIDGGAQ